MKVHLLKNPSDDGDTGRRDPYETHIDGANFISVLDFAPVDVPGLIQQLGRDDFDALIVTSQRAVDVLREAIDLSPHIKSVLSYPTYTVGPATASRLRHLGFTKVYGEDTGNGAVLSEQMLASQLSKRRFIFLAGEVHRRQLPESLISRGNTVDTVVVYRTAALDYTPALNSAVSERDWVVFFSPSGAHPACSFVKSNSFLNLRVAAIGPTTKAFLEDQNIAVNAMAEMPTAESLKEALNSCV